MMGRQLPLLSLLLPIYVLTFYAGFRAGFIECWPAALVAGLSFSVIQVSFFSWNNLVWRGGFFLTFFF